jgi:hypothetical protein
MMTLQQKVRLILIIGFFIWGTSLGIRYDAVWDSLAMYVLTVIMIRYVDK